MNVGSLERPRLTIVCAIMLAALFIPSANVHAAEPLSAPRLAARIDELLADVYHREAITPAEPADDAEFLRRLTLDLNGRIPTVAEARSFLADKTPAKRRRAIDERLASPRYVRHLSHVWRDLLLAQANPQDVRYLAPKIETWLAQQLREDVPYDAWVRALVTTPLDARPTSALDRREDQVEAHALAFFQANELKPENLAAATSRVFLGVNLDCAQCHNHPFADWKQQQFWQFAAFYAGVSRLRADNAFMPAPEVFDRRKLAITGTEQVVAAAFLDGRAPRWTAQSQPRVELANWLISPENEYFARAAANRAWSHLFGRGILEPLDGLGGREPPTHPELLDELAAQFVAQRFDWKFLLRAIALSQAYQRTSRVTHASHREAPGFSRMRVRGLSAEQVYDNLTTATGYRESEGAAGAKRDSPRSEILLRFASLDRPTEVPTSITQALTLMNGRLMATVCDREHSKLLAAIVSAPFLNHRERINTLYLATLSREPTLEEMQRCLTLVERAEGDAQAAYADLLWMLLNTGEFLLNH